MGGAGRENTAYNALIENYRSKIDLKKHADVVKNELAKVPGTRRNKKEHGNRQSFRPLVENKGGVQILF